MSSGPIKIFVNNVSLTARSSDLKELFEKYGQVTYCKIVRDYAFVHMNEAIDAKRAIEGLHDTLIDGSRIRVELSDTLKDRNGPPESYNSPRYNTYQNSSRSLSDRDSMSSYNDRRGDNANRILDNRDSIYQLDRRCFHMYPLYPYPIYPPVDPYDYCVFNGIVSHPPLPSYLGARGADPYTNGRVSMLSDLYTSDYLYPSGGGPIRNGRSFPMHSRNNFLRAGPQQTYRYTINSRYFKVLNHLII